MCQIENTGRKMRFVVQRKRDIVHVAAASCHACAQSKKSHFARKGELICGECKHPMRFEDIPAATSDERCAMPAIPYEQSGDMILIKSSDVKAVFGKAFR